VLAADSTKIASAEEVRSAQSHRGSPAPKATTEAPASTANANGTSINPDPAPQQTDPMAEEYNAAVVAEAVRLMDDPKTTWEELRDVWQVLAQGRLAARRITPPAGMDADGDGLVPVGSAVAFVGKERKAVATQQPAEAPAAPVEDPAAPAEEPTGQLFDEPAPKRTRKAAVASE
jgi:hypothetical protein